MVGFLVVSGRVPCRWWVVEFLVAWSGSLSAVGFLVGSCWWWSVSLSLVTGFLVGGWSGSLSMVVGFLVDGGGVPCCLVGFPWWSVSLSLVAGFLGGVESVGNRYRKWSAKRVRVREGASHKARSAAERGKD